MNGGTYICSRDDNHRIAHFSSEPTTRIACVSCEGWMMLEDEPIMYTYKKTNILWLGMAHVIWFFLKPLSAWLDKHIIDDDDE